ncbi:MAG: hypothetical protein R6V77_04905, partial [Candidatus Cloacimonadaceae bacterium]
MRRLSGLLIIGALLLSLFTGCDRRKVEVPTSPQQVSDNDATRVLPFEYHTSLEGRQYYYIHLYNTSDYNKDVEDDDVVEVVIADSV